VRPSLTPAVASSTAQPSPPQPSPGWYQYVSAPSLNLVKPRARIRSGVTNPPMIASVIA